GRRQSDRWWQRRVPLTLDNYPHPYTGCCACNTARRVYKLHPEDPPTGTGAQVRTPREDNIIWPALGKRRHIVARVGKRAKCYGGFSSRNLAIKHRRTSCESGAGDPGAPLPHGKGSPFADWNVANWPRI